MKQDPPVRRDGRCAQCRRPRKLAKPQRGIDASVYAGDPFCSSTCCRLWHDAPALVVTGGDPAEKRGRYVRSAA